MRTNAAILVVVSLFALCVFGYPPHSCMKAPEILADFGYSTESYTVTTEDGYRLTLFHITGKAGEKHLDSAPVRPPILLQHGIAASCDNFVGNESHSPAMYFYDRGMDVWLPNTRGNRYSGTHQTLNNESEAYWNFSFEEMGTKDTHAFVDFVYTKTQQKVMYLGFSQGFMQLMAGFALDPTFYRQRLAKIVGWAPVVRIDLTTHVLIALAGELNIAVLGAWAGLKYVFGFNYDSCISSVKLCDTMPYLCKLKLLMSGDFTPFYDLDSGFSHDSERVSYKTMTHMANNILHHGFYRLPRADGTLEEYNLALVSGVPIGLFIGQKDMLASVANGQWLAETFNKTGSLAFYREYQYLGHQTVLLSKSRNDHIVDTADFLLR